MLKINSNVFLQQGNRFHGTKIPTLNHKRKEKKSNLKFCLSYKITLSTATVVWYCDVLQV